jgi:excisionase family DNA binding protein
MVAVLHVLWCPTSAISSCTTDTPGGEAFLMVTPDAPTPLRLYPPETAARSLGVSRTKVWELLRDGELSGVKVGKRRLIFADSLDDYVQRLKSTIPD